MVDYFGKSCGNPGLKISKVEKISNRSVQKRFLNELAIIREKNPNLRLDQILRVLWHGTKANSPLQIAQGEAGLDMRYARGGTFGAGIYFADTAAYSISYVHPVPGQ